MLSFSLRDDLGEILDLIESVSGGFPTYSYINVNRSYFMFFFRHFIRKGTTFLNPGKRIKSFQERLILLRREAKMVFVQFLPHVIPIYLRSNTTYTSSFCSCFERGSKRFFTLGTRLGDIKV